MPVSRCRQCAIIGSSAIALEGAFGAQIDSYDIVIRVNAAPTKGYEQHVGRKTTFRIGTREGLENTAALEKEADSGTTTVLVMFRPVIRML